MKKTIYLFIFQFSLLVTAKAQASYETAQVQDIQAYSSYMTANPIVTSIGGFNPLLEGAVVYYLTNENRWGKFRIQQYGYNLIIEWTTFNQDGSVYSTGVNLTIRGTWECNLDLGQESVKSVDFWWEHNNTTNLVPKNGARFYRALSAKQVEPRAKKPSPKTETEKTRQPVTDVAQQEASADKIVGTDAQGRIIYESPRGGQYYINANGNKSYIKKDIEGTASQKTEAQPEVSAQQVPQPKAKKVAAQLQQNQFVPQGKVPNSEAYYQANFSKIKDFESQLQEETLGSLEESPKHLKNGDILFYKTQTGNYGKMQILSFGFQNNVQELYVRYTTYKPDGKIFKFNEFEDMASGRYGKNSIGTYFFFDTLKMEKAHTQFLEPTRYYPITTGFDWRIENNLLFMMPKKIKLCMYNTNSSNTDNQNSNTLKSTVTWQAPLSNGSTTSVQSIELKACVETTETVREYTLIQNGQRLIIPRGLMPKKANDCLNSFSQMVTLREGENTFQLVAQLPKGDTKSDIFTLFYDKKAVSNNSVPIETKIEKRIALVVGNADYTEGFKLKNPVNDANLMAQTLKNLGFRVMQVTNVNKAQFERAIRDFSAVLSDYNVALFYYAGHGIQLDGENYLLPIDAKLQDKKDVRFEAVKVKFAVEEFENHPDNVNIVILDACRNNPFRSWTRGGSEGFKAMYIGGTVVAFATSSDATASDGSGVNGLYTEELVKQMALNQPIETVFRETRKAVLKRSNGIQNPQEFWQLTESFYFKK